MSDLNRELVTVVVVGMLVLDSLFLGVIDTAVLRFLGRGGWYRALPGRERITYQGRHGVISGGFNFALPNRVVVSDRRFAITIGWSRAGLVIIPLDAILSVTHGSWWWLRIVHVTFMDRARRRTVSIVVSRSAEPPLLATLQAALSTREGVRPATVSGDATA